jgi:DNA adenine methylase
MKLRPALKFTGGKWKLAPRIISFFPNHSNYLEPCGGSAAVLLQKKPAPLETFNDADGRVINFFRVLRETPSQLIWQIRSTPWSKEELISAQEPAADPLEDARRFFVLSWQAVSHTGQTWRSLKSASIRQKPLIRDMIEVDHLLTVAERLHTVQFESGDALDIIEKYDHSDTLIYFDPPFPALTHLRYHRRAADLLQNVKARVVVAGLPSPEYKEMYEDRGWIRYALNKGEPDSKRGVCVWLSPRTIKAQGKPRQEELPFPMMGR